MKIWHLKGDTYDGNTTDLFFKSKPSKERIKAFMLEHYYWGGEIDAAEELETKDYTIRCHRYDMKFRWIPKVRNLSQYLDDIFNGIDGEDGDYGTCFTLLEVEVLE